MPLRAHVHVLEVHYNDVKLSIRRDTEEIGMGRKRDEECSGEWRLCVWNAMHFLDDKKIGVEAKHWARGLNHLGERMFN